ncbi:MAG TPA: acetyl-CoA carboxylase, biotin carboxyl carrier protein [Armatimonadetes bacterium]|nr:acetyl-CoA carboxylase, biotin carboxyl carrier protein [Armatimonadota bacterium]
MKEVVSLEELRQLIALVEQSGVEELRLEEGELTIIIRTGEADVGEPSLVPSLLATPAPKPQLERPPSELEPSLTNAHPIVAPIMGVFYRAPGPDEPPYVEEGDWVEEGQCVGLIEAMKIYNDIPSDCNGRVVKIVAQNEQLVAEGEVLMWIEPQEAEKEEK